MPPVASRAWTCAVRSRQRRARRVAALARGGAGHGGRALRRPPSRFIVSSGGGAFGVVRWVVPALTVLVLVALGVIRPSGPFARVLERPPDVLRLTRRRLTLGMIAIVSAAERCLDHPPDPPARLVHERHGIQPDGLDAAQPLGKDADADPVGDQPRARR